MSHQPKKYLRCPCTHCGQSVDFPDYAAGGFTLCSHCGKSTATTAPASAATATSPVKPFAAPAAQTVSPPVPPVRCPKCGRSASSGSSCLCASAQNPKRKFSILVPLLFVLLFFGVAVGVWVTLTSRSPQTHLAVVSKPIEPIETNAPSTNTATVVAARPQSTNRNSVALGTNSAGPVKTIDTLRAGEIRIQRPKGNRGSQVIYAMGSLTNTAATQRLGVKIEIGLQNNRGETIDETSDYQASLGPGETWKFRALVHNSLVVTGKVTKINEDH